MFANTITLTIGATPRILNRINQDSYGSEYSLMLADREINLKIRHSKETAKAGSVPFDRHNVTIKETVYVASPGVNIEREVSYTIRNQRNDDKALAEDTASAMITWAIPATVLSLVNWEN